MKLSLEGVTRRFGAQLAVEHLDLNIAAGEVVTLLGPSGCGKSTTLRIAAGVERQDGGRVLVDGQVVSDSSRHDPPESRGVGLMFQEFALFPHLTAAQNVAFGLKNQDRAEKKRRAVEELERVGLAGRGDCYPHQLSGGEQQRVALARALAPKPSVMLMDEPFSSLDHRLRDQVRDEALGILKAAGAAVLLVTHDPDEALRMSDRIALMRAGRIVQIGAPYHVYNHPVDRKSAAFFSDLNIIHGMVRAQQTDTPFGRFLTPGLADGADVEIIIRPQHLKIDVDEAPTPCARNGAPARGVVERARFMGAYSLIEARMDYHGDILSATIPGAFLPPIGEPLWLSLRRDRCFVFPCAVQTQLEWPYLAPQPKQGDRLIGHASPARRPRDVRDSPANTSNVAAG
ncbi:MAG: ABC transporter ATP-binding protein [Neomegalonema sp.]|nr:ABC transporter ATP-binding protein [Neomegalonema sp.]